MITLCCNGCASAYGLDDAGELALEVERATVRDAGVSWMGEGCPDVGAACGADKTTDEDRDARWRRLAAERQRRYRERKRDAVRAERDDCVTERDENIDCLIDCNQEQEINILKKQAIKQTERFPSQKSVARAARDSGVKKRDNCVTERDRPTRKGRGEWAEGQLPLPKVFDGDRPNLQIPEVQEAMTRWLTMRRKEGYFKLRLELWLDMLDQMDMTVQKNGVAEAVRWLDTQTEAKRLGRFLEYEPPPRPKPPPPPPPPEPQLTPEQEAEYLAKEEDFYRKLGGDAWKRYLKKKNEKK